MKLFVLRAVVVVAALVSGDVAFGAITADEVTALPGWDKPLPSKHYSGLIPILQSTAFIHYWFIESENNPSTDPVVVWLNGGPGSSSLIGLLTENGQFLTNDDSLGPDGNVTLLYNPYSWSRIANVLYVEQPKGVGFSYCAPGQACENTDESVGRDFAQFLQGWFAGFSEFKANDFYITGESYAGIYIPEIMAAIENNTSINLKGAAIGDGCIGNQVSTCGFALQADQITAEFLNGHGMYPQPLYTEIMNACGDFTQNTPACTKALNQMNNDAGNYVIYNIYDQCGNDQITATPEDVFEQLRSAVNFTVAGPQSFQTHPQLHKGVAGALNDYVCGGQKVMVQYLAQPDVQKALHVSTQGTMTYHRTASDLRPLYKHLAQKYRILIYSGSVDACVPYWGTEVWTRELGFPLKEAWHPWQSISADEPKQTTIQAGYVVTYDAGDHDFTFLTVSGAGHMVPTYKPAQAFSMFDRFINNKKY